MIRRNHIGVTCSTEENDGQLLFPLSRLINYLEMFC